MPTRRVRFHVGHFGTATCGPGCPAWQEPEEQRRLHEALAKEDDEGTVYSITNAAPPPPDDNPKELE